MHIYEIVVFGSEFIYMGRKEKEIVSKLEHNISKTIKQLVPGLG